MSALSAAYSTFRSSIDGPFILAEERFGIAGDYLKLIFSFLLSYPLAAFIKRFPANKPGLKNAYIILVSLFYILGLFELWDGLLQLFISAAGAYLIASTIRGSLMPWVGFVFLMGHMSYSHIHRQRLDTPDKMDITGAQMVLVMKLTAFCWNVYDGTQKEEHLSPYQRERMRKQLPGLFDYAGYVLFFPSLFAGPAFDYVDYERYLNTTMFDLPKNLDPAKAPRMRNGRIPRSGRPALKKALEGLLWIVAFVVGSARFSTDLILSDDFLGYSFPYKIVSIWLITVVARTKYYGVWNLTEGACIISGLGFNTVDEKGQVDWNRLQNIQPATVEGATSIKPYLDGWNINTNKWLKHYIYLRVTPRGTKAGFKARIITFVTSAFWHGFYPGYYLAFLLGAFVQSAGGTARKTIRPFFLSTPYKRYYDVLTWLTTHASMSFTVLPFLILRWDDSLEAWSRVNYWVIIAVVVFTVLPMTPLMKPLDSMAKARVRLLEKREAERKQRGLPSPPSSARSTAFRDSPVSPRMDTSIMSTGSDGMTEDVTPMSIPDLDHLRRVVKDLAKEHSKPKSS